MKTIQQQLDIPREEARILGFQTLEILKQGMYHSESGAEINISQEIENSKTRTITYFPEIELPVSFKGNFQTQFFVKNMTTLSAAKSLADNGDDPAILNMASATSPGGGWLSGAKAQEEYLARSTTLYATLQNNPMYQRQDFHANPFYDDYVIYSPDVVVFRDDDGELMENFFFCSMLTSPAVQANAVRYYMPSREPEIAKVMEKRILKLLSIAHTHKHTALVLGAWGCGAFGNDGNVIAGLFKNAFQENFPGVFNRVIFAITDWSPENRFIGPFTKLENS